MKKSLSIPTGRRQAMAQDASRFVRAALIGALRPGRSSHATAVTPLRVEPAATPIAPRQMATAQPGDAATHERLAASYEACLRTYRDIARAQGCAADVDDVGAVMAFFVAMNLHVLHGVDVEAGALQPLERQLRGVTRVAAHWDDAPLAQRQLFFERIAIVSILMSRSLADAATQGPAAVADVRRSARAYLQHVLGLDPDGVTLGDAGLELRERSTGMAATPAMHA
jgi:hypothetical protein